MLNVAIFYDGRLGVGIKRGLTFVNETLSFSTNLETFGWLIWVLNESYERKERNEEPFLMISLQICTDALFLLFQEKI